MKHRAYTAHTALSFGRTSQELEKQTVGRKECKTSIHQNCNLPELIRVKP